MRDIRCQNGDHRFVIGEDHAFCGRRECYATAPNEGKSGAGGNLILVAKDDIPPGNTTLSPGKGFNAPDGDIFFYRADGSIAMHFRADGKVFIRGEEVDDNKAIYQEFLTWLRHATACMTSPGDE